MSASEFLSHTDRKPLWVLASDISDSALETARQGIYPDDKMRNVPTHLLHRYFLKGNGRVRVKPELKNLVEFRKINLDGAFHRQLRDFDIVFCRNVIIYFDRQTQEELMAKYYEVLHPGGYLFLGHSETLHGMATGFEFVTASIYREPCSSKTAGHGR